MQLLPHLIYPLEILSNLNGRRMVFMLFYYVYAPLCSKRSITLYRTHRSITKGQQREYIKCACCSQAAAMVISPLTMSLLHTMPSSPLSMRIATLNADRFLAPITTCTHMNIIYHIRPHLVLVHSCCPAVVYCRGRFRSVFAYLYVCMFCVCVCDYTQHALCAAACMAEARTAVFG